MGDGIWLRFTLSSKQEMEEFLDSYYQNHQVDIDALTSDETNEIPLSVWNIIPKSSAYIKYVLEVGAYTTFESFASITTSRTLQVHSIG